MKLTVLAILDKTNAMLVQTQMELLIMYGTNGMLMLTQFVSQ